MLIELMVEIVGLIGEIAVEELFDCALDFIFERLPERKRNNL